MADDDKKVLETNHATEVTLFLVLLFILSIIIARFENYFAYKNISPGIYVESAKNTWVHVLWPRLRFVSWFLSLAFAVGIGHYVSRLRQLVKEERAIYGSPNNSSVGLPSLEEKIKNEKWERIIELINSPNASDWRLAIIEADIILDELLRITGHWGDTVGEMLKGVEPGEMKTLEAAWDAHKVRNKIAHAGSEYDLTEREAKRVIALYEAVFKEAKII